MILPGCLLKKDAPLTMFLLIYIITSSNLICSKSAHARWACHSEHKKNPSLRIDILILLASLSAFPTTTGAPLSLGQGSLLTLIPVTSKSSTSFQLVHKFSNHLVPPPGKGHLDMGIQVAFPWQGRGPVEGSSFITIVIFRPNSWLLMLVYNFAFCLWERGDFFIVVDSSLTSCTGRPPKKNATRATVHTCTGSITSSRHHSWLEIDFLVVSYQE